MGSPRRRGANGVAKNGSASAKASARNARDSGEGSEKDDDRASLWFWAPHTSCGAFRARRVLVPAGASRGEALDKELGAAPLEVLDLVPLCSTGAEESEDDHQPRRGSRISSTFNLKPGSHVAVVFKSVPFLRFEFALVGGPSGAAQRPVICPEAAELLRRLSSPIRIVAFVGPGRCGKSSTLSRLSEDDFSVFAKMSERCGGGEPVASDTGEASGSTPRLGTRVEQGPVSRANKFVVSHDADPMTAGVDFVALPHPTPGEGTVLFLDCEGSDNPCTDNTANYRAITTLLLSLACQVVVCTFGGCQESNLEDLSATLAAREMIRGDGADQCTQETKLCLLVIACRFKALNDAYFEASVLSEKEGQPSRNETRSLIRSAFPNRRLRTLPHMAEEEAYRQAIAGLRQEIFDGTAPVLAHGLPLSGAQLLELIQALADQISHLGLVEPAGVMARVVQRHLETSAQVAEAAFEQGCVQPLRDELQAGYVERLEPRLRAGIEEALREFDVATTKVTSEGRLKTRTRLEQALSAALVGELRGQNEEHRCTEEVAMEKATKDLLTALETDPTVPRRPLMQVPEPQAMRAAELLAGDSEEGLLALHSKGIEASLRCTRVITSGRAQLKACLQHAFARLRAEVDLLRDTRTAELEAAAAQAQQAFEEALRSLPDHYVADKVVEPFGTSGRHQSEARAAFDSAIRALPWGRGGQEGGCEDEAEGTATSSCRGPWERAAVAARRAQFIERLEVLFHRVSSRNARVRTEAGRWCDELSAKLVEDFQAKLPEIGKCFSDDKLAGWEKERMASLDDAFSSAVSVAQQDDGLPFCAEVVGEAKKALRVRCWDLWQESLRANSQLREAAEATVDRMHSAALEACREKMPEISGYVEPGKLATMFEPVRTVTFAHFETSLAASDLGDQGAWGEALCERAQGSLAMALHRLMNGLQEEADTFRRAELDRATELAQQHLDRFEEQLPSLPLVRGLEDSKLEELRQAASKVEADLKNALQACCFQCLEAQESAMEALRARTEPVVRKICAESIRKRQISRRMTEATESSIAIFQDALRPLLDDDGDELPHYMEESAWLPTGALGVARSRAEALLAEVCSDTEALAEPGDPFEGKICQNEKEALADALQEKLEALSAQNVGHRSDEEAKATTAVEVAFDNMSAGLPKRPLRRVLAESTLAELGECAKRCEESLRKDLGPLWCSEVRRSAESALKAQLADVVRRTREASERLAELRRSGMEKAVQKQKERFQVLCKEALEAYRENSSGSGWELDGLAKRLEFLVMAFEDEAKNLVGDGVLVERGPWEEDLLKTERAGLDAAMDEALKSVETQRLELRWKRRARLLYPLGITALVLVVLLLVARTWRSQADVGVGSSADDRGMPRPLAGSVVGEPGELQNLADEVQPAPLEVEVEVAQTAEDTSAVDVDPSSIEEAASREAPVDVETQVADTKVVPKEVSAAGDGVSAQTDIGGDTRVDTETESTADVKIEAEAQLQESPAEDHEQATDARVVPEIATAPADHGDGAEASTTADAAADSVAGVVPTAEAAGSQIDAGAPLDAVMVEDPALPIDPIVVHPECHRTACVPVEQLAEAASVGQAAEVVRPEASLAEAGEDVAVGGSCLDAEEFCQEWASQDGCATNPSFMLKRCRLSCGACSSQVPRQCSGDSGDACRQALAVPQGTIGKQFNGGGSCRDSNVLCEEWAEEGGCSSNASFMSSRCPRSCGICK
mmetsp:Transcript_75003/g.243770  ORF Transcript_75003/g.243770 Transcript_75003/m.243770 type:complete len:1727 (+) Transcript_75003:161-5341(+)|eukprot:CAMPEP_0203892924 /NCGR_PEP_ID=MMETSP0359-20131031/36061_1 /ASSEMBLY_ACC=CAM_ASM_000338 /TAXON_ID=268821 /ORGANISM="Scrippsiella Hangoei, Strain SHTV-5" /LENGTH=1726 /DNA_ID=CAMNT_0050814973 /DNA_START=141 /DNA_END=5321 /DNA_ORIENTATION=-